MIDISEIQHHKHQKVRKVKFNIMSKITKFAIILIQYDVDISQRLSAVTFNIMSRYHNYFEKLSCNIIC